MKITYQAMLASALFGASFAATANTLSDRNISIEPLDSPYVTMTNNWGISQDNGTVTLYGRVQRNRTPFVGGGFVDVSVIGPDGKIQETVRSRHIPRGSRKERGYFSRYDVTLPGIPAGSRVQLTYTRAQKK